MTILLATSNAVKLDGVSFFSSFSGEPNHFLARRLSQTMTRRVQTSYCYRGTSLKAVTTLLNTPETETISISDGLGIVSFLKGKSYLITGATGFLAKVLVEKLLRMTAPLILAYGKDQIPDVWGDYQSLIDIIPVDMVVNATIAAMAKHGCGNAPELKVYNVSSSSHANPLRLGELMDFSRQHLRDSPLRETAKDLERMKFHSSLEGFTSSVSDTLAKQEREIKNGEEAESHTTLSRKGQRKLQYFESLARIYQPYLSFQARFDDTNTRSLIHKMSTEERKMFEFDGRWIEWEHYIVNVHLSGLKGVLSRGRSN